MTEKETEREGPPDAPKSDPAQPHDPLPWLIRNLREKQQATDEAVAADTDGKPAQTGG